MDRTPGIDVSRWQGEIDWTQVAGAGYRFAVVRATIGNYYTDPRFVTNWDGARDAGLLVSAYHVVRPDRPADSQIERLLEVLGDRQADLPLVLDVELGGGRSADEVAGCVRACLVHVEQETGRRAIIYTGKWFWDYSISASPDWGKYDLWVAHYGVLAPSLPVGWSEWMFWQYSEKGQVPGIGPATDLDWFAGSYDDLLAYAGQRPEPEPEPEPDPAPEPEPEPEPAGGRRARVLVRKLNVRAGPGINYADIGDLRQGDVVDVLSFDGKDVWVEIEPGKWAAMVYRGRRYLELE